MFALYFSPVVMTRLVLQPFTFSNGVTIPPGTLVTLPTSATQTDERNYENPNEFDGFQLDTASLSWDKNVKLKAMGKLMGVQRSTSNCVQVTVGVGDLPEENTHYGDGDSLPNSLRLPVPTAASIWQ